MPSGQFLMEDFYYAGGLPAVLRALGEQGLLHKNALTVNGKTIWDNNAERRMLQPRRDHAVRAAVQDERRHRRIARQPVRPTAPSSSPRRRRRKLMQASRPRRGVREHRGFHAAHRRSRPRHRRALRHGAEELRAQGLSGHGRSRQHAAAAEAAASKGITDMVRISDARMSGTAYGTVVLHVAPEAAAGGPLALVAERRHDRTRRRPNAGCIWTSRTKNWRAGVPQWKAARRADRAAATPSSMSITCCRRIRARISISSSARSGAKVPKDNH